MSDNTNNPIQDNILRLALESARYRQALVILNRHGIYLNDEKDGVFPQKMHNGLASPKLETFPEALDRALNNKLNHLYSEIRDLKYKVTDLERQIPKKKEITLNDGSTMHVIEEDES